MALNQLPPNLALLNEWLDEHVDDAISKKPPDEDWSDDLIRTAVVLTFMDALLAAAKVEMAKERAERAEGFDDPLNPAGEPVAE